MQGSETATGRLAVDIGGTFTDVVFEYGGQRTEVKVLTTPAEPERGVIEAIGSVLGAAQPRDVGIVIHGTTLATNAIIERKGARIALITTEGFRDSVEMAHENRFDQYDVFMERPDPLAPRYLRFGVPERVDAQGRVRLVLDEAHVVALVDVLRREGVESVAIGFMHSYANPAHERRARDLLSAAMPDLAITLSSEVCPEVREYERFSTACANAYVQPLMARYLRALRRRLDEIGLDCPLLLMTSGGGLTTLDTAIRFPIRLVESGPAGGAILAADIARRKGIEAVLSFDMGGTTAKICLIDGGEPQSAREFEVDRRTRFLKGSGLPIRVPVVEMVEIGAGGGSIASLDPLRRIAVGPESAGADPGPACYDRGGAAATVTDADLVLGRIDPAGFAGGSIQLAPHRAEAALARDIGAPLGLDPIGAAFGVSEIVEEAMANAARVHAVERGKDLRGRTLIAFGGAAPLHAARLAEKLGIATVLIPPGAGVGSAIGFLRAPVAFDVVRTRFMRLSAFDPALANELFAEMEAEAIGAVRLGAPAGEISQTRTAEMRYAGQGHEIVVNLPIRRFTEQDIALFQTGFNTTYEALFGRTIPNLDLEIVGWTLRASAVGGPEPVREMPAGNTSRLPAPGFRSLYDRALREMSQVAVYQRAELAPGARIAGPAVIAENATTTIVSGVFIASIDPDGAIRLEREVRAGAGDRGMRGNHPHSEIELQVMWNRLIAVVEEQAQTLVRTAFGTATHEAGDLSAGVYDRAGNMVAQAVTGTPGHINSMAKSVGHVLAKFPLAGMSAGDVFITNNPWMGTGHFNDIVVVTPTFRGADPVGLFACTLHVNDIGGRGVPGAASEIYEEGLHLPILKLVDRGRVNDMLVEIVAENVREPVQVVGDIYSEIACNEIGGRRLIEMMAEYGLSDIEELSRYVFDRSRAATLEAIRALPFGTYHNAMTVDGIDKPLELCAALTIGADGIDVDFTGTAGVSSRGINVPICYTEAYTSFGVKCIVAPRIPNNAASLAPIRVTAPEGCILNAPHPAPVQARHIIGQMLPDVVFGCLRQAVPDGVPAEGTSCLWNVRLSGGPGRVEADPALLRGARTFNVTGFHSGGAGARPRQDGLSATAFPSGVRNVPVEITESMAPVIIHRKEYRIDSGGAGASRGGLGQVMEIGSAEDMPFAIATTFDRIDHPARGVAGGDAGMPGRVRTSSGRQLSGKGYYTIQPDERLFVEMPGGGGYGSPLQRDSALVARDVRDQRLSVEAARAQYGVVVSPDFAVDAAATQECRRALGADGGM